MSHIFHLKFKNFFTSLFAGKIRASEESDTSALLLTSRSSSISSSQRTDNRNDQQTTFLTIFETETKSDYDEKDENESVAENGSQKGKEKDAAENTNDHMELLISRAEEICDSLKSDKSVYFTVPSAIGNNQTNKTRVH